MVSRDIISEEWNVFVEKRKDKENGNTFQTQSHIMAMSVTKFN